MAKLPNVENAWIDETQLTEYLLSLAHKNGRHKARFLGRFGFTSETWNALHESLLRHANTHEALPDTVSAYGPTYRVEGPLASPDGRNPSVRVIWMIRNEEDFPRLVTVVPMEPPKS